MRHTVLITIAFAGMVAGTAEASGTDKYEVWAIDQSNSPGRSFGGTLYIWDGHHLENAHRVPTVTVEKIDLGGAAAALCLARTGANPVRPHMMAMNPAQSHAIIVRRQRTRPVHGCGGARASRLLPDIAW